MFTYTHLIGLTVLILILIYYLLFPFLPIENEPELSSQIVVNDDNFLENNTETNEVLTESYIIEDELMLSDIENLILINSEFTTTTYEDDGVITPSVNEELRKNTELKQFFNLNDENGSKRGISGGDIPEFIKNYYEELVISEYQDGVNIKNYMEQITFIPNYFMFNVSTEPFWSNDFDAELRIYRLPTLVTNETISPLLMPPYYLLKIYQVVDINQLNVPDVQVLLGVHCVSMFTSGWEVFNIKSAIKSWTTNQKPNLGLLISSTTLLGDPVESIKYIRRKTTDDKLQPVLVIYEKQDEGRKTLIKKRSPIVNNNQVLQQQCQRIDWYVNFTGYNFIVAPEGYYANKCNGFCNTNALTINYSKIKHIFDSTEYVPCCTPKFTSVLHILYFESKDILVLRSFDNMIIDACLCQ